MKDQVKPGDDASRMRRRSVFPFRSPPRNAAVEEGAGLVEFALAAAIFFSLLSGIMGVSLLAYSYAFASNAAREATRYAIVRSNNSSSNCSGVSPANCIAQTADIAAYVKGLTPLGINVNNLSVTTNWLTSTGGSCGTAGSCMAPGNQVSYTYDLNMPFVPQHTFTISSSSQMVMAQ